MSTTIDDLEARAAERDEQTKEVKGITPQPDGPTPAGIEDTTSEDDLAEKPMGRVAVAIALPVIATGVLVGGVFTGVGARLYAVIAGLMGIGLAVVVARMRRNTAITTVLILVGLFVIGLLMVVPSGIGNIGGIRTLAAEAAASRAVLRPPVGLTPGWQAIIGWLMGVVGFVATWLAVVVKAPSFGLLAPLPFAAIACISVPESQQVGSGIVVLVLFATGLGILASESATSEEGERPPLSYEIAKGLRALPLLIGITVALVLLSRAEFLFPASIIDPAQEPQKPKTVPLSEVEDRVLFDVESKLSGPWRIGGLDEYDGTDWRLPPFAQNRVKEVPKDGVVDKELEPGVRATFTIRGLGGAVLPGLPNTVGIIASGPSLGYDSRNGNIRLIAGTVTPGQAYTVAAAALPTINEVKESEKEPLPKGIERFTEIGEPPPAVVDLIAQAPKTSKFEEFDFLRTWILNEVTAVGAGTPKSVTAERVQDMIGGSQKGSPFEMVAAQAMLARWIGIPSRIGYGFDGGELIGDRLEVRPRHGATFPEVYFVGHKWLPIIGTPKKAEPTVGSDASLQQVDPSVLPSDDISVQVFLPVFVPPDSVFGKQVLVAVLIAFSVFLLGLIIYATYPGVRKLRIRSQRRTAAIDAGPRARLALAYAEWRDYCTDLGFRHPADTPLHYLDRFVEDEEHTELAWLVTRGLWGDLRDETTPEMAAAAEELSRSLRRRLGSVQPATVRAVAAVSRLSLKYPYAPDTDLTHRAEERRGRAEREELEREERERELAIVR
ncbi:MAG TPA: transglutaminaseTgpA domain-containing protein [Acidimicrobiales bacterium]|nr:transglutaminaseTgpA domain-containing protein [Acidimicrobiales bacterium]